MSEVILKATSLSKNLRGQSLLRDFSVELERGVVVGLVGKNGAGKSTLFDLFLGFALPSSGRSEVFGFDSRDLPAQAKSHIGFVPQHDELVGAMTGAQQLALTASLHDRWDQSLIDRLAREWEVPLQRRINKLSGGERQKLSTLSALGHTPDLLILDEPAASLDPVARRRFMQQILEIAADPQRSVLFATHQVGDLERVAERIWMLREGALTWRGGLDDLKESIVRVSVSTEVAQRLPATLPSILKREGGALGVSFITQDGGAEIIAHCGEAEPPVPQFLDLEEIFLALNS